MNNNKKSSSSSKICKKHMKHQQSPGVCSLCLRERLLKISKSSSRVITHTSSSSCSTSSISTVSSVSSSSSGALSNTASPMHDYPKGKLSFLKSKLKRSKSMVFVCERSMEDEVKKKSGFWSKLMHSKTMREVLTTRV